MSRHHRSIGLGVVVAAALAASGPIVFGQTPNTADSHVAAAKAAAGTDHPSLFGTVCSANAVRPAAQQARGGGGAAAGGNTARGAAAPAAGAQAARGRAGAAPAAAPASPPRDQWYAPPAKVFDNLYFVGQTEYSAWAVNTSEGIILIDTIFDYSVEAEVVDGLRKMGLDPSRIRYAIVSHGHGDHSGGAKFLQDRFGTRIIMGAPDWDLVERTTRTPAPRRDIVAQDGQRLTLGDTTVTMYLTPGHTPGTISTLVPVRDNGRPHLAAAWGGTAFNFPRTPENFQTYINSADRFRDIVVKAGADVIIANHTNFDESKRKIPALALRKPGEPHPYVVGNDAVRRYVTIAGECARAALAAMSEQR